MSLSNAVFKSGATWSPSGGTDVTLASDGRAIANGISTVVAADTNLLTRRGLVFQALLPAMPANSGAYARLVRNSCKYSIPFLAADGKLYNQTVRIETSFHAEYTDKNTAIADIAALVSDSDFTAFWQSALLT
jgi:hypothetical protein